MPSPCFDLVSAVPFNGPWRPIYQGARDRRCDRYPSAIHWIEASRFDLMLEVELALATVLAPGAREASKFARRNANRWRSDWRLRAHQYIAQALALLRLQHPEHPAWALPQAEWDAQARQALVDFGVEAWLAEVATQMATRRFKAPRVMILGAANAPHAEVGRRITALHRKLDDAWNLLYWRGRHSCLTVHDWADRAGLGIDLVGVGGERLTVATFERLLPRLDLLIAVEQRGNKRMEALTRRARGLGKAVEVWVWGGNDGTTAGADGAAGLF